MSDLQVYSKISVYVNSALLSEEASVTIKHTNGAKEVNTVAKGFAGMSQGSPTVEVTIKNAVPAAGFEYSPFKAMQNLDVVELACFGAGLTMTTKGFITESTFQHAVDTESSLDFTFKGQFVDFE